MKIQILTGPGTASAYDGGGSISKIKEQRPSIYGTIYQNDKWEKSEIWAVILRIKRAHDDMIDDAVLLSANGDATHLHESCGMASSWRIRLEFSLESV